MSYKTETTEHDDFTEFAITDDEGNLVAYVEVFADYINADFKADDFVAKKFNLRDDGTIASSADSRVDIGRSDASSFLCVHTDRDS